MKIRVILAFLLGELKKVTLEQEVSLEDREAQLDKLLAKTREEIRVIALKANGSGIARPCIFVVFAVGDDVVHSEVIKFTCVKIKEIESLDEIMKFKASSLLFFARTLLLKSIGPSI